MAQAPRPSNDFKNKQNVNPSINRITEATAEDFAEASSLFNWFADWVDSQVQPEKFYNFHTSIPVLAAAHPNAVEGGWAIIVPENGNTPFVASYTNGEWVSSQVEPPVQFFDTKIARDQAGDGQEGIFYIIKDAKLISLWYNNKYNDFGKDGNNGLDAYEVAAAVGFTGTRQEWLDSLVGPPGPPGPAGDGFENIPATANKIFVTDGAGGGTWEDKPGGSTSSFPGYQIIDLGDILTDPVETDFNDDALADSIVIDKNTVVKAIQDGKAKQWLFVGTPATYDGNTTLAVESDFYSFVSITEMQAAIAKAKTEMEAYHNANSGAVAPIPITTSRNLAASDNGKKLLIEANVTLTYPAAGLGSNFEFNAVCGAAGTLTLDDENTGADLDGGTFLSEGEIGHAFYWPSTGKLTTKGDWV